MSTILDFLVNNYIWFLVIVLMLLFALIGYLVDMKKDERFTKKIEIDKEIESRLDVAAAANITLNQMVQKQSQNDIIQNNNPNDNESLVSNESETTNINAPVTQDVVKNKTE